MDHAIWHRGTSAESGKGLAICEGAKVVAVVLGDGFPVGKGNGPASDARANVICAAPALLAAAKAVLADCEGAKDQLRAAVAQAEAVTFAPTMATALQARVRGMAAWNHTEAERRAISHARRNGAGVRVTFVDGSAAFLPKGTADVRIVFQKQEG